MLGDPPASLDSVELTLECQHHLEASWPLDSNLPSGSWDHLEITKELRLQVGEVGGVGLQESLTVKSSLKRAHHFALLKALVTSGWVFLKIHKHVYTLNKLTDESDPLFSKFYHDCSHSGLVKAQDPIVSSDSKLPDLSFSLFFFQPVLYLRHVLIALVLIFPTQQKGSVKSQKRYKNLEQASLTLWDDCSVKIGQYLCLATSTISL